MREEYAYGEEISLLAEGGKLLYDIDFEDLLDRPLKDVGLFEGRTLTVVDEETNRVNVEFLISEAAELETPTLGEIPTKPATKEINGTEGPVENGVEVTGKKRPREDEDDLDFRKKARVAEESQKTVDNVIVIDDDDAVMID